MKNSKRIAQITIKRMMDSDPDTSYLGEYSDRAKTDYAIDRKHSTDCQSLELNHEQAVNQLERVIAYLETVRQLGQPPENIYWAAADEAQDVLVGLQDELQECDCSGGDMERGEYRYFNGNVENYKGESPEQIREYVLRDYERMERLHRGDWCYIGIRAEAEVLIPSNGHSIVQEITSGGLWGVESDSDASYFKEIEDEELSELRKQLYALGFSKRAIATAVKNVAHENS
jgi:hypothetical protein